jgi:hypothetical protein
LDGGPIEYESNTDKTKEKEKMAKTSSVHKIHASAGDAAVSGLFNGLLAGACMAGYLVIAGLLLGQGASFMGYFAAGSAVSPILGTISHLAVSAIYGIIFSLILHWLRAAQTHLLPGWTKGLAFALLLWLVAVLFVLPGPGVLLRTIPAVHFLMAHIVYGLMLGYRQKP